MPGEGDGVSLPVRRLAVIALAGAVFFYAGAAGAAVDGRNCRALHVAS